MDWLSRLLAGVAATLAVVGFGGASQATLPAPPPRPLALVSERLDASQTPSRSTIPDTRLCPQWWGLARQAGWTNDLLPMLDYVLWRESRCDATAHNTTRNRDKSADLGLTQVNNRSWCLPTRYYPKGYLQTVGVLSTVGCEQLFDPIHNLRAAKAIFDYAQEKNGNGWQPWKL
jgi:hypothetical protein